MNIFLFNFPSKIQKIAFGSVIALSSLFNTSLYAEIQRETVRYTVNDQEMVGHLVWDDRYKGKRPGVIVVHEWWGLNDYVRQRAEQLALMGYTALALDMYGDGQVTTHPKTARGFASAVGSNMPLAKKRFEKAMLTLQQHSSVSDEPLSAIGYCFGGGIVLNMARMGLNLKGVASFHGSLSAAVQAEDSIRTKIAVFTGEDDTAIPLHKVEAFEEEMDDLDADYSVVIYPDTVHSFTNPEATELGKKLKFDNIRYNRHADLDSWAKLSQFLSDLYR